MRMLLVTVGALVAALANYDCFAAPAAPLPPAPVTAARGMAADELVTADGAMALSGAESSGVFAGLQPAAREVNVLMQNRKGGRYNFKRDGWTRYKKFRTCSLMARQSTVKGMKIIMRQLRRGKSLSQLDHNMYPNYKMKRIYRMPGSDFPQYGPGR